jgi:hypothetical protein
MNHRVGLVYDIDDLLVQTGVWGVVQHCLERAVRITAPSKRLLATLNIKAGGGLSEKSIFLANAGREHTPVADMGTSKPQLLWISSAVPQGGDGLRDVCRGIAGAAQKSDLKVLLVGRFPLWIDDAFPSAQRIGWIPPSELLDWLSVRPLIAVAPLSTDLPEAAQDFADCKSDIKIAQFGSSGVAGIYSPAAPYLESDLPRRLASRNDADAWMAEICRAVEAFPGEGMRLATNPAFAARRPSVLAETLLEQLERAAATAPAFTFRALAMPRFVRAAERTIRTWLR